MSIVAAAALVMAACGSDDDGGSAGGELSGADQELAEAISAELVANDTDGFAEVFDTDCMGQEVVKVLGGAEGAEADFGVTVDNVGDVNDREFEPEDAERVVGAYSSCGSIKELFTVAFTADGEFTDEQASCMVEDISDEQFESALAEDLGGVENGPAQSAVFDGLLSSAVDCGVEF
jgi:hypothetical protein